MGFTRDYSAPGPARSDVDRMSGPAVLEFGNAWCGHCRRAEPLVREAFDGHEQVPHIRIADASGARLGRLFGVTLWPTLVFLRDGKEMVRLVRPQGMNEIRNALARIDGQTSSQGSNHLAHERADHS